MLPINETAQTLAETLWKSGKVGKCPLDVGTVVVRVPRPTTGKIIISLMGSEGQRVEIETYTVYLYDYILNEMRSIEGCTRQFETVFSALLKMRMEVLHAEQAGYSLEVFSKWRREYEQEVYESLRGD